MAAKKKSKTPPPPREPRLIARFIGEQFGTLMFAGVLITVLAAWAIWDKLGQEDLMRRVIPTPLYLYLGLGIALCAIAGAGRYLLSDEVEEVIRRRRQMKESKVLLKEARRGQRRYRARLDPAAQQALREAEEALREARNARDWPKLGEALAALDRKLDDHLAFARKSQAREYAESIGAAVLIALFLRAFVVEAFKIPSGSMIPTLQVGDHIFVNKFIYGIRPPWPWDELEFGRRHPKFFMGLRKPKRGEVIVFKYPKEPEKDFIKRIVAVEGDTVAIRDNQVYVNDGRIDRTKIDGSCEYDDYDESEPAHWVHRHCEGYREQLDGHEHSIIFNEHEAAKSWAAVKVPPNAVFVMGDNRDNSHDSRYWGFVPFENIKGKAMVIWFSWGEPEGIRIKRLGRTVE